jgi:hypothetical protein
LIYNFRHYFRLADEELGKTFRAERWRPEQKSNHWGIRTGKAEDEGSVLTGSKSAQAGWPAAVLAVEAWVGGEQLAGFEQSLDAGEDPAFRKYWHKITITTTL